MNQTDGRTNGKRIALAVIALAAAVALLLIVWRTLAPQGTAGGKQITVQVVHSDGSSRDFALDTGEAYLGPALVEHGVVVDNQGPYGLYILEADGEAASEADQEWWKLTKGGEMVNTSADTTPIAEGEHYELTFTVGYDSF